MNLTAVLWRLVGEFFRTLRMVSSNSEWTEVQAGLMASKHKIDWATCSNVTRNISAWKTKRDEIQSERSLLFKSGVIFDAAGQQFRVHLAGTKHRMAFIQFAQNEQTMA